MQREHPRSMRLEHARQRGANALEYIGLLVASALVVGVIAAAVTGVPLAQHVTTAVCRVIGQGSCAVDPGASGNGTVWDRARGKTVYSVGDSFIAGEGTQNYVSSTNVPGRRFIYAGPFGTEFSSPYQLPGLGVKRVEGPDGANRCHQGQASYSRSVAHQLGSGLVDATCSGAVTSDITNPNPMQVGVPAQIDMIPPGTDGLVLLSIGGNDAGFGSVITTCLVQNDCRAGEEEMTKRMNQALANVERQYAEIRNRVADSRNVVVVGYPELWNQPDGETTNGMKPYKGVQVPGKGLVGGLTVEEQAFMNEKTREFNRKLAVMAQQNGFTFVSMEAPMKGHGVGSDQPYLNGLMFELPGPNHDSFLPISSASIHPTAEAQAIYEDEIKKATQR